MRAFELAAAVFAAASSASSAPNGGPPDMIVYMDGDSGAPPLVEHGARATVTEMFGRIGIRLGWRNGPPAAAISSGGSLVIQVRFVGDAPHTASSRALAYVAPFSDGVPTITVIYSRVHLAAGSARECRLFAHVLAHEIGHVLKRTDGHSPSGVMKAHWDSQDLYTMSIKPLEFTRGDAQMMRQGLDLPKARARVAAATPSNSETPPRSPAWQPR